MRRLICIIFVLLLGPLTVHAKEKTLSFNHLNKEDGLSSISVKDV